MNFTVYRLVGGAVLIVLAFAAMNAPAQTRQAIGIAVAGISIVLLILSRTHLGASFSMKAEAKVLVTKGLYSRIQHPLYFFLDLVLWGVIVFFDLPWLLAIWAILLAVHVMEARREERILLKAFGDAYLRYQSHTWF